jgi:PTH1 family peptidyl-tRNA hydrolase
MVVIVGLGNPGRGYANTRHNVGFLVADALAAKLGCRFKPGKGEFTADIGTYRDNEIVVAKPATSMNESGVALLDIVEHYEVHLDRLLIVFDDFQLPLGALRMRQSGSDGGHNGMYSVIYHLQSDTFPRLRCGIGTEDMPQDKSLMADFVLSKFDAKETPVVEEMVNRAVDACLSFVVDGIDQTMSLFNRKTE